MAFWTDAIGNMGSLGAYKKCKMPLLQKHHNSSDFLDITKPTLEKTHTRATKTSLAKTLQKWCFYEFGPIPERTLTRATLATNLLLLKHHQSAVFLEFVTKMKVFWHKYLIDKAHIGENPYLPHLQQNLLLPKHHPSGLY